MPTRRRFLAAVATTPALAAEAAPTLFELRRYRMRPGRRDTLLAMFESVFQDAYEAGGTRIVGSFRDLDDADRWVWIRAFPDAVQRGPALANFYGSAAWVAGREAANATIADVAPALLLRSHQEGLPPADAAPAPVFVITVHPLAPQHAAAFPAFFDATVAPTLSALGVAPFASFVSDTRPNAFPRQPVHEGPVFVSVQRFASRAACDAFIEARQAAWRGKVQAALARRLAGPLETMRLQPAPRSRWR
ncbi:MAG: NIPSNAP family protein [Rubrivivax sp.]|nr:NIPSNAP family protein [Rubrivivax sp.]